jgi:hypothetical protein
MILLKSIASSTVFLCNQLNHQIVSHECETYSVFLVLYFKFVVLSLSVLCHMTVSFRILSIANTEV